jgi:hypothetical protein
MFEIDHMLNGKISRQRHQEMIEFAQRQRFAREIQAAQGKPNVLARLLDFIMHKSQSATPQPGEKRITQTRAKMI